MFSLPFLNRSRKARVYRVALTALALVFASLVAPHASQAQATAEGTVITNTATATYTDANSNTYSSVNATSSVTVGFTAALTVTSPATVTPASPSTADTVQFTLTNTGNGVDTLKVSSVTPAAGLTVTGYRYNTTTYASLATLNTALSTVQLTSGSNYIIKVIYNVASGQGGAVLPLAMTAASIRTPATTASSTTNVDPPTSYAVAVTPKSSSNIDHLPSNGTQYTQTFNVQNNGNASDTYTLTGAAGTDITIVSVNGVGGTNGGTVTLANGANQNFNIVYTVNNAAAAGSIDSLKAIATSTLHGTETDTGYVMVRVVKASLSMTKQAYKDDKVTTINNTTDRVLPGQYIQYKITVTNNGVADAQTISVSDALPSQVTYDSYSTDAAGWTISQSSGTVTANLSGTLSNGASRYFWIRVQVK